MADPQTQLYASANASPASAQSKIALVSVSSSLEELFGFINYVHTAGQNKFGNADAEEAVAGWVLSSFPDFPEEIIGMLQEIAMNAQFATHVIKLRAALALRFALAENFEFFQQVISIEDPNQFGQFIEEFSKIFIKPHPDMYPQHVQAKATISQNFGEAILGNIIQNHLTCNQQLFNRFAMATFLLLSLSLFIS